LRTTQRTRPSRPPTPSSRSPHLLAPAFSPREANSSKCSSSNVPSFAGAPGPLQVKAPLQASDFPNLSFFFLSFFFVSTSFPHCENSSARLLCPGRATARRSRPLQLRHEREKCHSRLFKLVHCFPCARPTLQFPLLLLPFSVAPVLAKVGSGSLSYRCVHSIGPDQPLHSLAFAVFEDGPPGFTSLDGIQVLSPQLARAKPSPPPLEWRYDTPVLVWRVPTLDTFIAIVRSPAFCLLGLPIPEETDESLLSKRGLSINGPTLELTGMINPSLSSNSARFPPLTFQLDSRHRPRLSFVIVALCMLSSREKFLLYPALHLVSRLILSPRKSVVDLKLALGLRLLLHEHGLFPSLLDYPFGEQRTSPRTPLSPLSHIP